ncbi:MAG: phage tail protein [Peptococcaceae bacterium]|nr:phage tail protein [Peptococcaceae bacterium]
MAFSDYFYYLLHRVFKRAPQPDSDADKLTKALGPNYDGAVEAIFKLREQAMVITAQGKALDQLGRDRLLPRYGGESDDAYRLRLLNAFSIHSQVGTADAMTEAFKRLGFTEAEIIEMKQIDPDRWAEFKVVVGLPESGFSDLDRNSFLATIRKMKPAHTKLASLDLEASAVDIHGAGGDITAWAESVSHTIFTCPLPAENLYPGEDLYPC